MTIIKSCGLVDGTDEPTLSTSNPPSYTSRLLSSFSSFNYLSFSLSLSCCPLQFYKICIATPTEYLINSLASDPSFLSFFFLVVCNLYVLAKHCLKSERLVLLAIFSSEINVDQSCFRSSDPLGKLKSSSLGSSVKPHRIRSSLRYYFE